MDEIEALVILFTEVLDRCLEAERDMIAHDMNSEKRKAAQERRDRHRQTLIEAYTLTLRGAS